MQTVERNVTVVEKVQQARITSITIDCEDGTELVVGADIPLDNVHSLGVGDYLIVDSRGDRHIVGREAHEASLVNQSLGRIEPIS